VVRRELNRFKCQFIFVISVHIVKGNATKIKGEGIITGEIEHGLLHFKCAPNFFICGVSIKQPSFSASFITVWEQIIGYS
jgi:hypothetical protein